MASSVKTPLMNPSNFLSTKSWITIGVALFLIVFLGVAYKVYQAQPAKIVVNPTGLSRAEYQALNGVMSDHESGGFFTASLPLLQEQAMALDWVSQVNIERQWGRGVVITALPRKPIAKFGSDHLIDAQGQVYKPIQESELHQPNLIMLQGDADQSVLIMQQMQQVNQWFMPLDIKVKDMVLTPRMTWVILFDDGLRIIVDNENTSQKLMNVSHLLQSQLNDKRSEMASIDLRYKNGFVISWNKEDAGTHVLMTPSEATLNNDSV